MNLRLPLLLPALLALAACRIAPTRTGGAGESSGVTEVQTRLRMPGGEVTVTRTGEEGRETGMFVVAVGEQEVFRDSMSYAVEVYAYAARLDEDPVVVFALSSGGSGCPVMYRMVHLTGESDPLVTEPFGDCSDIPRVSLEGERLRMRFPGFYHASRRREPGFRPPPPSTYVYDGAGRMRLETP